MGFPGGFIGGFALISAGLYLTSAIHRRNRLEQSASLSQQSLLLRSRIDPLPAEQSPHRNIYNAAPSDTEARANARETSLTEQAKEAWNDRIIRLVTWAQEKDWDATRQNAEVIASKVWRRAEREARRVAADVQHEVENVTVPEETREYVKKVHEPTRREG